MKIAIIGAGFFGLHVASILKQKDPNIKMDIFDMAETPMSGASVNNQNRLHLGFHYPRSGYTIYQSIMGYDYYLKYYGDCVTPVSDNYYAIHENGEIGAKEYLAVMDAFSLDYSFADKKSIKFKNPNEISLLLKAPEQLINSNLVRNKLLSSLSQALFIQAEIDNIDAELGYVYSKDKCLGKYDYIVNATYMNPNLGLSKKNSFQLKHELTLLLSGQTNLPFSTAITIMDGPFCSIYPHQGGLHTLSSVLHTPFIEYLNIDNLYSNYKIKKNLSEKLKVKERILAHVQELVDVKFELKECLLSTKTKLLTDKGDSRVTEVKRNGKVISVMCGKLDAVIFATKGVLEEIYG